MADPLSSVFEQARQGPPRNADATPVEYRRGLPLGREFAMRILRSQPPTPEQLLVIRDVKPGVALVRGAAGSGKTMTVILRLKLLNGFWQRRLRDGHVSGPIRILILTYNRTLRGYVEELARDQVDASVNVEISTFGRWSTRLLPGRPMPGSDDHLRRLGRALDLPTPFLLEEAYYVMGRFLPAQLDEYLGARREGRGTTPRMEQPQREALLNEVIGPYTAWKENQGLFDWNDLAVESSPSRR